MSIDFYLPFSAMLKATSILLVIKVNLMLASLKRQLTALARKLGLVRQPHEAMRKTADERSWSAGTSYKQFQKASPATREGEMPVELPE